MGWGIPLPKKPHPPGESGGLPAHLGILEAEEQGVPLGPRQLHAGHGHDVAEEGEGGHQLQLLLVPFPFCGQEKSRQGRQEGKGGGTARGGGSCPAPARPSRSPSGVITLLRVPHHPLPTARCHPHVGQRPRGVGTPCLSLLSPPKTTPRLPRAHLLWGGGLSPNRGLPTSTPSVLEGRLGGTGTAQGTPPHTLKGGVSPPQKKKAWREGSPPSPHLTYLHSCLL